MIKAGRPDQAVDQMHGAMRLDPHYPVRYLSRLGRAQFAMEAYQDAASTFELAASRNPEDDWTFVYLAAAYGHLGRVQEARAAVNKANSLRGNLRWSYLTLENVDTERREGYVPKRPERKLLREGLRKAAVKAGGEWVALVTTTSSDKFEVRGATMIDISIAKALHDREVPFVDTRPRFATGHIPRAHSLDYFYEFDEARILDIVNKTQEVVIYGPAEDRDTALACAKAVAWGFEMVSCFMGGLDDWTRAGYAVESGS